MILATVTSLMARFLVALHCTIFAQSCTASAESLRGLARIVDGDTLEIKGQVVRLHGIDAAESGQRCVASDKHIVRPGDFAEDRLAQLSKGGVSCEGDSHDDYGRLIARCYSAAGANINATLVSEGLAWAFVKYSTDYVQQESRAMEAGAGIWSMACEPPWDFRAKRWDVAAQKAPNGCPIKGNISERGRIYHTPWSRHYAATRVNEAKGERWFCSEGEAIEAGWRAPIR